SSQRSHRPTDDAGFACAVRTTPHSPESPMAEPLQEPPSSFSLVRGGLFYRLERRFRLVREDSPDPAFRMWAGVALTFLPLVVLAAIQGVLYGARVTLPLLSDWTIYARFVIAIPLLVAAEGPIDGRVSAAIRRFRTSELIEG